MAELGLGLWVVLLAMLLVMLSAKLWVMPLAALLAVVVGGGLGGKVDGRFASDVAGVVVSQANQGSTICSLQVSVINRASPSAAGRRCRGKLQRPKFKGGRSQSQLTSQCTTGARC